MSKVINRLKSLEDKKDVSEQDIAENTTLIKALVEKVDSLKIEVDAIKAKVSK